jgi:uncharacterized membrane protein (DUF485 family)
MSLDSATAMQLRPGASKGGFWLLLLAAFFGYILLIAFNKELLALPIGGGTISLGIPLGLGVIALGILLTGIYVRRANSDFDPMVRSIREDLDK